MHIFSNYFYTINETTLSVNNSHQLPQHSGFHDWIISIIPYLPGKSQPFPKEQELKEKLARQSELDRQLNLDNKEKLLGKDNDKSFEIETEADRKRAEERSKNNDDSMDIDIDDM